jgi:hypothetical protein
MPEAPWMMSSYAVRTVSGESVDRAVHELGMPGAQGGGVRTTAHRGRGAHVLDEHVRLVAQVLERTTAVGLAEIEHNAALRPVGVEEHRAHTGIDVRAQAAGDVTGGSFDFDHVGTELGEQQRRVRARDHRGEVDDPDALERKARHRRIIRAPPCRTLSR